MHLLLAAAVLTLAAACNLIPGGSKKPEEKAKESYYGVPVKVEAEAAHELDLGDVEANIRISGVLAAQSQADNVKVDSLVNERQELNLTTITVTPPVPAELWLTFRVKCRFGFAKSPVLLRAKVMRDKQEIDSFSLILGPNAAEAEAEHLVNALKDLPAAPASSLIHVQAEFLLFPEDTDPATIDAATATVPEERIGHELSNPVRINYVQGAASQ